MSELDRFRAFAADLADAAGAAIRPYFRQQISIDAKADASPVTIADRAAERAMRGMIEATFPDHGIIGEEFGRVRETAEHVWVLDPIDGTRSFICGVPMFGTLIALLERGRPLLGVIDQPISGERWVGVEGRETTLNGATVRCRACPGLAHAVLLTTTEDMFRGEDMVRYQAVKHRVGMVRHSTDCYGYALLATGFADLVIEANLQLYDYAALVPVVQGAGGLITDWQGGPLSIAGPGQVLAAGNAALHAAAIEALATAPGSPLA